MGNIYDRGPIEYPRYLKAGKMNMAFENDVVVLFGVVIVT